MSLITPLEQHVIATKYLHWQKVSLVLVNICWVYLEPNVDKMREPMKSLWRVCMKIFIKQRQWFGKFIFFDFMSVYDASCDIHTHPLSKIFPGPMHKSPLSLTAISDVTGPLFQIRSTVLPNGFSFEIHPVRQYLVHFTGLVGIVISTVYKTVTIFKSIGQRQIVLILTSCNRALVFISNVP